MSRRLCWGVCIGGAQEIATEEGAPSAVLPTFAALHSQSAVACASMLKQADPEGEPVQILCWTDDGEDWIIRDGAGVAQALDTCRAVAEAMRRDYEAHLAAQAAREPDAQRDAAQDDPRGEGDR